MHAHVDDRDWLMTLTLTYLQLANIMVTYSLTQKTHECMIIQITGLADDVNTFHVQLSNIKWR
jgi:hypothetical protein